MLKKLSFAAILLLSVGTNSYAEDFYAKIGAGISSVEADMDNGNDVDFSSEYILTVAFGKKFGNFSAELEYSHETSDWDNKSINNQGDGESNAFMINGYYNFDLDTKITPYIGVGIGYLDFDDGYVSDSTTAYQGMIGGTYEINERFDISLEYRYRTADFDLEELSSNNFIIGTSIKF